MKSTTISGMCGMLGLALALLGGGEARAGYNAGTGIYTDDNEWLKTYQPQPSVRPRPYESRSDQPRYAQPQFSIPLRYWYPQSYQTPFYPLRSYGVRRRSHWAY